MGLADEELRKAIEEAAAIEPEDIPARVKMDREVCDRLAKRPGFSGAPPRIPSGRGLADWTPDTVAPRLYELARERGASAALAWLQKVEAVRDQYITGGAVKALYGLKCDAPIALSDEVQLCPFAQFPPCPTRQRLLIDHEQQKRLFGRHIPYMNPPSAVLYRKGAMKLFIADCTVGRPEVGPDVKNGPGAWFNELDNIVVLLGLARGAAPVEAGDWLHCDDHDYERIANMGITFRFPEFTLTRSMFSEAHATPEALEGRLFSFKRLPRKNQTNISLALQRLIRSRSNNHLGNRAIDLGIAIEALLMQGERDEASYKIGTRAARLLRKTPAGRVQVFDDVRALYNLRSTVAHGGELPSTINVRRVKRGTDVIVEAADAICTEVIQAFLALGKIPEKDEWSSFELS